jgi:hypothetical protein
MEVTMMKKTITTLVLLLVFVCFLPAQESTPVPTPGPTEVCLPCTLYASGHVLTLSGDPIEGATVSMTTEESGTVETVTDASGYYLLIQGTCGCGSDALFTVVKEGYIPREETHYVSSTETTIDFMLSETAGPGGEVWFVPRDTYKELLNLIFFYEGIPTIPGLISSAIIGDFTFTNEVHVNTGSQLIAAYNVSIAYDSSVVIVNTEEGQGGIIPGDESFVSAVSATESGTLFVSGFDAAGIGPASSMNLFTIYWLAQTYNGTTDLVLSVNELVDETGSQVGILAPANGTITIETTTIVCVIGDFNNDGNINIVDALLLAQYYVGLNPPGTDIECADVNCDGMINIIDALLIAQYYVGLITEFC